MKVLTDKQFISYGRLCRYSSTPVYYDVMYDKFTTGISRKLDTDTTYQIYTVQPGDTLDTIAVKFYGNPTYFWVICDFNRINNAFTTLCPGRKIKIPTISSIKFEE